MSGNASCFADFLTAIYAQAYFEAISFVRVKSQRIVRLYIFMQS
jgi:hypothetical protein